MAYYGWAHQQRRKQYAQAMAAGQQFTCTRCAKPIHPGQPWDLDHPDTDPGNTGRATGAPAHAHCNRSAGANKRNQRRDVRWL
jgi:hypothetical protein